MTRDKLAEFGLGVRHERQVDLPMARETTMKTIMIAAAFALSATGALFAEGTGAQGYFELYNDTEGNVLVGFYTSEDAETWSTNWIDGAQIAPGEHDTAEFNSETGSCQQYFTASWLGADGSEVVDDPIEIDICEASNVYLGDNEISFD